MKKYLSELIGTMVLVLFGCGTAVLAGSYVGVFGIAVAFGLSIVAMAYVIGEISGCHINPAVTVAMLINKKIEVKEALCYVVAQVLGAIVGTAILYGIVSSMNLDTLVLGQNVAATNVPLYMALIIEVILTFVFIFTILGVTSKKENESVSGLVIGLTLTFVHIIGIPLTGTSVNPARSIAPAIFTGGDALSQIWIFILGPIIGAVLAAFLWKYLSDSKTTK